VTASRLDPEMPARKRHSNSYWAGLSLEEQELAYSVLRQSGTTMEEARKLIPPMRGADGKPRPPCVTTVSKLCQELRMEQMLGAVAEDEEMIDRVRRQFSSRVREEWLDEIMDMIGQEVRQKTLRRLDPDGRTAAARLLLKRADQRRFDRHQEFIERQAKKKEPRPRRVLTEEQKQRRIKEILGVDVIQNESKDGGAKAAGGFKCHPRLELLAYQRRWVDDTARWKFGLMSRQVGKDLSAAYEGIQDCLLAEAAGKKTDWLIVAPSERQSLESLNKWKEWAEAFKVLTGEWEEEREAGGESLLKAATITFAHGSRVIAVPGKPDTVRGYSANVLLTEFAFFEQPDATWQAILPTITNPMRGGAKKVRLITTPNGIGNKAHDIWVKNYRPLTTENTENTEKKISSVESVKSVVDAAQWSCHFVDIYKAVAEKLPVNIEELRAALDDAEGWAQEFECQFLDVQTTLLPYELIATCESSEASVAVAPEFWGRAAGGSPPLVMGLDFGRRRDLTVAWSNTQVGDVAQTVEVLELEKMSTPEQVELLRPRLRQARRVCLDYTGPGIGLGDYLAKEFGEWEPERHRFGKIELCSFTAGLKVEIFSKLRMAFEKRCVRVPVSRLIREDLHSVNRVSGAGGQVGYRAPHNADGHADRCTALALAWRAGSAIPASAASAPIKGRTAGGNFGMGEAGREGWP
jgi:phage FluMu gp28-like protein